MKMTWNTCRVRPRIGMDQQSSGEDSGVVGTRSHALNSVVVLLQFFPDVFPWKPYWMERASTYCVRN